MGSFGKNHFLITDLTDRQVLAVAGFQRTFNQRLTVVLFTNHRFANFLQCYHNAKKQMQDR